MILFTFALAALAVPPDSTPGLFPVGSGAIERMAISVDGDVVAGRDAASMTGWLIDVNTWETVTDIFATTTCEVTGVAIADFMDEETDEETLELWFSCADGTIDAKTWDGHDLTDVSNLPSVIEVDDSLEGIWYYFDYNAETVFASFYALSTNGTESTLHIIDLLGTVDSGSGTWPQTVFNSKYQEAVVSGNQLIMNHESDKMSVLTFPDGPLTLMPQQQFGVNINVVDITPSPQGVYAVGSAGNLVEYSSTGNTWVTMFNGLLAPSAVVASLDDDDQWMVVTGDQIKVWEMNNFAIVGDVDNPFWESAVDANSKIQDAVVYGGYLFGGGVGGNLHIGTARPWVYPEEMSVFPASPIELTAGDTVTVTFMSDSKGDYDIYRGGGRTGDGERVASGTIDADGVEVVDIEIDFDWTEGENQLFAIVTADATGLTGHASGVVSVDNPPQPPDLTDANLYFGDEELFLRFTGIKDADLDHYEIYVSETKWFSEDWQDYVSGGPEFEGNAGIQRKEFPLIVPAAGGDSVDKTLKPLTNHVKYYVGVRAVDEGGLVGPMSKVISEIPRPTHTAADLAGEKGGGPCSTSGQTVGWMAVLLGMVAVARRRSGVLVAVLALGLVAPVAHGKDGPDKDLTPTYGDFEVRYGGISIKDKHINRVYKDNPTNILQMEFGPQFFKVLEVDLGIGFFQELAYTIDDSGIQSGDRTMLTWFPYLLDASVRAHIIDEQLFVPFARAGFDYVTYSEKWDAGGDSKEVLRGAKFGNHFGFGVNILLDTFAKERASLLEATSGINDSYLVIEWRKQRIDQRNRPWAPAPKKVEGFNFSGNLFTVGLKLDY